MKKNKKTENNNKNSKSVRQTEKDFNKQGEESG
jgi:hypothetical protein